MSRIEEIIQKMFNNYSACWDNEVEEWTFTVSQIRQMLKDLEAVEDEQD